DIFKEVIAEDAEKSSTRHINIFRTALFISILTYLFSVIISIGINRFFANNQILGIILLAFVFASTFAAMVVPILHNENLLETVIGKIIATIANLSEIVSIGFLTVLMIALEVDRKYAVIFLLLAIILVLYRVIRKYKIGKIFDKIAEGIDHLVTRVIIVLILFLVFLSDYSGGEYILGAFFAGMFVRHTQFSEEVVTSLSRIIYGVFAPMFFILVGTRIDILHFIQDVSNIWLVVILFFAYLLVELPVLMLLKWYNLNTIIPSMVLISCTVIVPIAAGHIGLSHNLFSETFSQAMILASILVCILGTILFKIEFPFGNYKKKYKGHQENYE
ncbi:MAG: cation:proton antiporter, partial [Bacilli bacterium]|nr:cation:proton antiporter [Bacilli bacterium]